MEGNEKRKKKANKRYNDRSRLTDPYWFSLFS